MDAFERLLAKGKAEDPFDRLLAMAPKSPTATSTATGTSTGTTSLTIEPKPMGDYSTGKAMSTATNEQERRGEAKKAGAYGFSSERFNDTATSAGYGVARGITAGFVDRLGGVGAALGEKAAATEQNPANPNAYSDYRSDYLEDEDKAVEGNKLANFAGNVGGAAILTAAASPLSLARIAAAKEGLRAGTATAARVFDAGIMGAAHGAGNTRQDDAWEITKGAAFGGAVGIASDFLVGKLVRDTIRGAPKREVDRSIAEAVKSDTGWATKTARKQLASDIDDVRDVMDKRPDLRDAMRLTANKAEPVIDKHLADATVGKAEAYREANKALGKSYTATKLLIDLMKMKNELPVKDLDLSSRAMTAMMDNLRNNIIPTWKGTPGIPWKGEKVNVSLEQLREWVSSIQGTAEGAMGQINGTTAAIIPGKMAGMANSILEKRLDAAAALGAKDAVASIRESDRVVSALLRLKKNVEQRGVDEVLAGAGIGKVANASNNMENAAAAALAGTGNIGAAAAVKASRPIFKSAREATRWFHDNAIVPLQKAAEAGKPWAEVSRFALENGVPQPLARTVFEMALRGRMVGPNEFKPDVEGDGE